MRFVAVLGILFLSGCATVGEMEPLNDAGLGDFRQGVKTYNSTLEVLGRNPGRNRAPTINRGYGHMNNMQYTPKDSTNIPEVLKGYIELERYLMEILK